MAPTPLLNQWDLADRWRMSPRTLERWRWEGRGPRYLKLGGRIGYRLEDIEHFERESTMAPVDRRHRVHAMRFGGRRHPLGQRD